MLPWGMCVVARGQLCLIVGDFNVEPAKSFVWQKGFRQGSQFTWKLPGRQLVVFSLLLLASVLGIPRVVVEETLW